MIDLRLQWDPINQRADLVLLPDGTFDTSHVLETMLIICWFTDRRADPGDPVTPGDDPRGWWGDSYVGQDYPGDRIGSKLWLRRTTQSGILNIIRGDLIEATQPLIDDGIITGIDVQTWFDATNPRRINAAAVLSRVDGTTEQLQFDGVWQEAIGGN